MSEQDTRDKVIANEVAITHLTKTVDDLSKKVDDVHSIMLQAQGAWKLWVALGGLISAVSGAVGAMLSKAWPWISGLPRG